MIDVRINSKVKYRPPLPPLQPHLSSQYAKLMVSSMASFAPLPVFNAMNVQRRKCVHLNGDSGYKKAATVLVRLLRFFPLLSLSISRISYMKDCGYTACFFIDVHGRK